MHAWQKWVPRYFPNMRFGLGFTLLQDGFYMHELGASFHDEGHWLDLGTREAYLDAHRHTEFGPSLHPGAHVDATAMVEASVIGAGASIGAEAVVLNCVLWPGARIGKGAQLTNCIVYSSTPATGAHHDEDL